MCLVKQMGFVPACQKEIILWKVCIIRFKVLFPENLSFPYIFLHRFSKATAFQRIAIN